MGGFFSPPSSTTTSLTQQPFPARIFSKMSIKLEYPSRLCWLSGDSSAGGEDHPSSHLPVRSEGLRLAFHVGRWIGWEWMGQDAAEILIYTGYIYWGHK